MSQEPSETELNEIQKRWWGWQEGFQEFLKGVGLKHYILEGTEPKPVSMIEWAEWFEAHPEKRLVAYDKRGEVAVSTVFLSLDHNFGGGEPILFETMVFGGEHNGDMDRYHTYAEALVGHDRMCKHIWGAEAIILEAEFLT